MNSVSHPKVLHIASGDLWAGAEFQLYTLVTTLHRKFQVPVEVVLLNHGKLEERLEDAGVKVTVFDESCMNGLRIFSQIYRYIKKSGPAVVHTHRTKENILGSLAALSSGMTATMRTVHGDREFACSWWQLPCIGIQMLDFLTGRFLQKRVIAVSSELATVLGSRFPAGKIGVIRNGIHTGGIEGPVRVSEEGGEHLRRPFRIGLAGRLVAVKRVDLLLDVARHIRNHAPGLEVEFRIYGDGPLRAGLEQQAREYEVEQLVRFFGHIDDLSGELRELDALVLTSDHEGLPMVLLEAMSLGVTVIAHAVGGIPELLDDGECGILVNEQSAKGYANAILELAGNPGRGRALSSNAARRVKRVYSAEENATNYLAEYNNINVQ